MPYTRNNPMPNDDYRRRVGINELIDYVATLCTRGVVIVYFLATAGFTIARVSLSPTVAYIALGLVVLLYVARFCVWMDARRLEYVWHEVFLDIIGAAQPFNSPGEPKDGWVPLMIRHEPGITFISPEDYDKHRDLLGEGAYATLVRRTETPGSYTHEAWVPEQKW